MKTKLLFAIWLLTSTVFYGQSIFNNPITGTDPGLSNPYTTGQVVNANITVSGIGRGPGVNGNAGANRYNTRDWSTTTLDLNDYFEFTLTPNSGYEIDFVSFVYTGQVSSSTPTLVFRSSIDGYTANIGTPTITGTTISLAGAAYQNITSSITFRLYLFGIGAASTTYSINDFTFNGNVNLNCTPPANPTGTITGTGTFCNTATLSFTGTATAPIVNYWQTSPTDTSTTNNAASPLAVSTSGVYYVRAFNSATSCWSAGVVTSATVTIVPPISITTQPSPQTITAGSNTSFSVVASNVASFQWQLNIGFGWNNITNNATYSGATTATLSITNATAGMNGFLYRCVLIGNSPCSPVNSNQALLTVTSSPQEINLRGNGVNIANNDTTPSLADHTDFGSATIGVTTIVRTFTIQNIGVANLLLTGTTPFVVISGANASDFSVTAIPSNAIVGGGFTTFTITFNPTAVGLRSATLSILNNDTDEGNYTFAIQGTGLVAAPNIIVRGVVGSNPTIADGDITPQGTDNTLFGTTNVGTSIIKSFRIENAGTASLTVTTLTFSGVAAADFTFSGITLPLTILPSTAVDFVVTFTPSATGTRTATLNINNSDATKSPYDFVVQGTGTALALVDINVRGNGNSIPNNSIYPTALNHTAFGLAVVGSTTVTRIFEIQNLGSNDLFLNGTPLITITGVDATMFSVTALPATTTITGGTSVTFSVTFNPTSPGSKKATIIIPNSDSDENPYSFNISGTAKGANNIYAFGNGNDVIKGSTSTSLLNLTNFGNVAVTTGVKQNTFVVTNLSGSARYFSNVTISGPDAAMFTVIGQPTANALISENSTSFTINFTPTSLGIKNATISFSSFTDAARTIPDAIDPVYTFAISGNGVNFTTCSLGAVQTLFIQDFEDTPATPTYTYTQSTDGSVILAGGTYNNGSTNRNAFLGSKSLQFRGVAGVARETALLNFSAVDLSTYKNIKLSIRVGAFRTGTQGLDIDDFVQVETSIDGGTNWSSEAVIRGFNNSRWDYTATGILNAYYTGTNNGVTVDTRNGNAELADGISTFNVFNLPAHPNLLIRIRLSVERDDEIWAIDNVIIEGQLPISNTWNGSTWTPATPTSTSRAILNGNYNTATNGAIEACDCRINSGTLTIAKPTVALPNTSVEIQTNLFINTGSSIVIQDDASLVMVDDDGIVTNNGTIQFLRETSPFKKFDYVYWSSPFTNTNIASQFAGWRTDYSFLFNTANFADLDNNGFDDAAPSAWQPFAGVMTPGRGYAIMAPTTGVFPRIETVTQTAAAGVSNLNNGIINYNLQLSGNNANNGDDFNLVGNPYPSAIYADRFIFDNLPNISGTIYIWTHNAAISISNPGPNTFNHTTNDYAMYNLSGGVGTGTGTASITGSTIPTGMIASGQGFMVEAQNTNVLIFNNSMRNRNYVNNDFYRQSTTNFEKDRFWMSIQNPDGVFCQQLVAYLEETTTDEDPAYDGIHSKSLNYVGFYSFINEEKYRIQSRGMFFEEDTLSLGFTSVVSGPMSIALNRKEGVFANGQPIYIEDTFTSTIHNLQDGAYNFTTEVGTFDDRFKLRYTEELLSTPNFDYEQINAITNEGKLTIKSTNTLIEHIAIYDIAGRLLVGENVQDSTFNKVLNLKNQSIIVKIKLTSGELVTKKLLL